MTAVAVAMSLLRKRLMGLLWLSLVGSPGGVTAAPERMGDAEEEGEQLEAPLQTLSGLTYEQLRRLRQLRQWLERRQVLRNQIDLKSPENRLLRQHGAVFIDRRLLAPLGQRYRDRLEALPGASPPALPPLPVFAASPPAETMVPELDSAPPDSSFESEPPAPASETGVDEASERAPFSAPQVTQATP